MGSVPKKKFFVVSGTWFKQNSAGRVHALECNRDRIMTGVLVVCHYLLNGQLEK